MTQNFGFRANEKSPHRATPQNCHIETGNTVVFDPDGLHVITWHCISAESAADRHERLIGGEIVVRATRASPEDAEQPYLVPIDENGSSTDVHERPTVISDRPAEIASSSSEEPTPGSDRPRETPLVESRIIRHPINAHYVVEFDPDTEEQHRRIRVGLNEVTAEGVKALFKLPLPSYPKCQSWDEHLAHAREANRIARGETPSNPTPAQIKEEKQPVPLALKINKNTTDEIKCRWLPPFSDPDRETLARQIVDFRESGFSWEKRPTREPDCPVGGYKALDRILAGQGRQSLLPSQSSEPDPAATPDKTLASRDEENNLTDPTITITTQEIEIPEEDGATAGSPAEPAPVVQAPEIPSAVQPPVPPAAKERANVSPEPASGPKSAVVVPIRSVSAAPPLPVSPEAATTDQVSDKPKEAPKSPKVGPPIPFQRRTTSAARPASSAPGGKPETKGHGTGRLGGESGDDAATAAPSPQPRSRVAPHPTAPPSHSLASAPTIAAETPPHYHQPAASARTGTTTARMAVVQPPFVDPPAVVDTPEVFADPATTKRDYVGMALIVVAFLSSSAAISVVLSWLKSR